jgi:hypothetical protein
MPQLLAADGAWCWFQDPRAVFIDGTFRRTYASWVTRGGDLMVGAWDHGTRQAFARVLQSGWGADDHGSGSLLVLPDRRLMVFYARHNGAGLFCRTATRPEDIDAWGAEVTVCAACGVTYSNPVHLRDEDRIHVFWRGGDWKPAFATSQDGIAWSPAQTLLRDPRDGDAAVRPYVKVAGDGRAAIHVAFTDGHPRDEPCNSIRHVIREGASFRTADGSRIGGIADLPLAVPPGALVYDGRRHGIRAWLWDLALDRDGRPVVAYTRLPAPRDHRYHYARWDGRAWSDVEIARGGPWFPETPCYRREHERHYSGGMALDPSDPSVVYLSRPSGGVFEIERWVTADGGATWSATPITRGSAANNVRPVVPRGCGGHEHVLWMHGRYVHYTRFRTQIRVHTGRTT